MTRPSKSKPLPRVPVEGLEDDSSNHLGATAHISVAGGSRKQATQARARETVDVILKAAACILEQDGYRAASTNAIARRAGVSVGSLYQYFASREDIFRALASRHRGTIHPVIEGAMERLAKVQAKPSTVLSDLLKDLLEAHAGRPALMYALETDLTRVFPPERLMEEAGEVEAATRLLASRIQRPPAEALANAWLAAEITAMVSRKLAHTAPEWLNVPQAQEAFAIALRALVD
jgi:AcrR family transcriptional regulator